MDNIFEEMLKDFEKSRGFIHDFEKVAGFDLPYSVRQRFLAMHASIVAKPLHPLHTRLTLEGGSKRDWWKPFTESVLGNVQEGLAASFYHLANIEAIEDRITSIAIASMDELRRPSGTLAGGNTRRLDFEYQAFIIAIRRTLEYLAGSIALFFKCESHSIRKLWGTISDKEPFEVKDRIQGHLVHHLQALEDVIPSASEERSVRDTLAHWKPVAAGCFNIACGKDGVRISILGGGEKLESTWKAVPTGVTKQDQSGAIAMMTLTPRLKDKMSRITNFIYDVYREMKLLPD